jgi:hypothetical protein
MRGNLVYQRVMDGRVIKVLRDELGGTYTALTVCHDGVRGVQHCFTDIADVAVVQQVSPVGGGGGGGTTAGKMTTKRPLPA